MRNRRQPLADREVDGAGGGQFQGDLAARVRGADDQHASRRERVRSPVVGAVELVDVGGELRRDRWGERHIEGSGGDDHLAGFDHVLSGLRDVDAAGSGQ